jgi:hypothetical protein
LFQVLGPYGLLLLLFRLHQVQGRHHHSAAKQANGVVPQMREHVRRECTIRKYAADEANLQSNQCTEAKR